MAAPEYVPVKPLDDVRTYSSPPRRPDSWRADRPGDLDAGQPTGKRFGNPGPDQGYVLTLVARFDGKVHLTSADHADDVTAGVVAVALKRASIFGRAPMIHDLTAAYTIWGFLDVALPQELLDLRARVFAGVAHPHHALQLQQLVDGVPESTLRLSLTELAALSWHDLLDVAAYSNGGH